ncbi:hypothetical protein TNCV_3834551 [Trichonephila clavipes]|nr:hypothetical protein TNCV_3834551 [Trichonephila clavipes]
MLPVGQWQRHRKVHILAGYLFGQLVHSIIAEISSVDPNLRKVDVTVFEVVQNRLNHSKSSVEFTLSKQWSEEMILPFRVTIEPAETHDTATHIMTYPPPCLSVGRRLSQYHTLVQVSAKRGPVLL